MTLYFPPSSFKSAPLTRANWRRRYNGFAVADFSEGARRDAYHWDRFREPVWARKALTAEYDGARLSAGLPVTEHRHAIVVVRSAHGQLERYFLPLGADESPNSLAAAHWFEIALKWERESRETVVRDVAPIRGAR